MSEERKTIYLCLAHMSEEGGMEQKYVKEAFDTNENRSRKCMSFLKFLQIADD